MLALSKLLIENKALMIAAAAVAFFVAAVLILLVFRLAFGRRLRMPGGRARQMRLGIVDAFDLDRQRQLVIVRRDNVEHLVMIGGPNDILIELQIIRTEARGRDKEIRDREPNHLPAPSAKPHAVEPKLAPALMPEPRPVAAAEDHIAHAPAHAAAARLPGVAPTGPTSPPPTAAPRRSQPAGPAAAPLAAPLAPASVKPQPAHEAPAGEGELLGRPQMPKPPVGPTQSPQPAGQGQAPAFLRWPARPGPTPPTPPQPKRAGPSPTPSAQPSAAPERPAAGPPVPSLEGLELLEEEMAKLLGRGPSKP